MNQSTDVSIVDISELCDSCKLSASYLVMESLPTYYRVNGIEDHVMANAIVGLIGASGSEIEKGYAAISDGETIGILTYIASGSLPTARLVGTQALMYRLSRSSAKQFRSHLENYDSGFGPIPEKSVYLGRFAIDHAYRGSGLAHQMMELLLSLKDDSGESQAKFSLHVDRENERGISFYRKNGFDVYHAGSRYFTMVR